MNRREIKNRIAFKIWTAVTRVEKYNTYAAVHILVTICFISFRDDSFTRGQSNLRRFIYERSVTNIRDRSLAYSFIYTDILTSGLMYSRVPHIFILTFVSQPWKSLRLKNWIISNVHHWLNCAITWIRIIVAIISKNIDFLLPLHLPVTVPLGRSQWFWNKWW